MAKSNYLQPLNPLKKCCQSSNYAKILNKSDLVSLENVANIHLNNNNLPLAIESFEHITKYYINTRNMELYLNYKNKVNYLKILNKINSLIKEKKLNYDKFLIAINLVSKPFQDYSSRFFKVNKSNSFSYSNKQIDELNFNKNQLEFVKIKRKLIQINMEINFLKNLLSNY